MATAADTSCKKGVPDPEQKESRAWELFKAASAAFPGRDVVDPAHWLSSKAQTRESWRKYRNRINSLPEQHRDAIMSNAFAQYMEFMYVNSAHEEAAKRDERRRSRQPGPAARRRLASLASKPV